MPPPSRHLSRILSAAERKVTAEELANVLGVPVTNAARVLRYWERAGYLSTEYERVHAPRRRAKPSYSLTLKGQAALYDRIKPTE